MNHHVISIGWHQGCEHVSRISVLVTYCLLIKCFHSNVCECTPRGLFSLKEKSIWSTIIDHIATLGSSGAVAIKTLNVSEPSPQQLQGFKNEVAVLR